MALGGSEQGKRRREGDYPEGVLKCFEVIAFMCDIDAQNADPFNTINMALCVSYWPD